jgi:phage-related protein
MLLKKLSAIYQIWYNKDMSCSVELLDEAVDFITSQDMKMQAKIMRNIALLEEFGSDLREPHSKKVKGTKSLRELRIKLASNICRLFYFHSEGKIYVVTSGFVKKDNKTNPRQISKAIKLMEEFLES